MFLLTYEKCPPILYVLHLVKIKHHISFFIMHSWNNTCCIKHGVKHKVHQVQRKQIDSHIVCS